MRRSEFNKINAALGRAEFALEELRKGADELRRKSALAKSPDEIAALNVEAAELLLQLHKVAMQFTPAIQPLISGWFPIQNGERHIRGTASTILLRLVDGRRRLVKVNVKVEATTIRPSGGTLY
jgi:hypothetical protein